MQKMLGAFCIGRARRRYDWACESSSVRTDDLLDRVTPVDGPLSPRELEVAALVAAGHTNKQIAGNLFVSERTAQNHVQHILTKLGLANRTQVASWYREHHPTKIERA